MSLGKQNQKTPTEAELEEFERRKSATSSPSTSIPQPMSRHSLFHGSRPYLSGLALSVFLCLLVGGTASYLTDERRSDGRASMPAAVSSQGAPMTEVEERETSMMQRESERQRASMVQREVERQRASMVQREVERSARFGSGTGGTYSPPARLKASESPSTSLARRSKKPDTMIKESTSRIKKPTDNSASSATPTVSARRVPRERSARHERSARVARARAQHRPELRTKILSARRTQTRRARTISSHR